ncbi:MAG: hypothetical protein HN368_01325, partial [Spirochaetales bacterium]|nr:hypothetical protein [Spirochaetales bacterium]
MKQAQRIFLLVAAFFMASAILSANGDADKSAPAAVNGDVENGLRILPVAAG